MASKKNKPVEETQGDVEVPAATMAAEMKQPQQNGVTRPKDGTATGRVWAIADELSEAAGAPIARGDVMKTGEAEGLNTATIATQYGRWRKFHNLGKYRKTDAEVESTEVEEGAEVEA